VELLIGLIHRINARAERRVEKELIGELANVPGKRGIFTRLVDAALEHPDDTVRDALYPAVPGGVKTLTALARELKATEKAVAERVRYQLRGSCSHYYRRMLAPLLAALEFRCNNSAYRPVMDAIGLLARYAGDGSGQKHYPASERVPVDGVRGVLQDVEQVDSAPPPLDLGLERAEVPRLGQLLELGDAHPGAALPGYDPDPAAGALRQGGVEPGEYLEKAALRAGQQPPLSGAGWKTKLETVAQARSMTSAQVASITRDRPTFTTIVETAGSEAGDEALTSDLSLVCWMVASGIAHARLWAALSSVLDRTDVPGASTPVAAAIRLSASDKALAAIAGVTTSMTSAGWRLYDRRCSDLRRSLA
jgi:hypothetical protein